MTCTGSEEVPREVTSAHVTAVSVRCRRGYAAFTAHVLALLLSTAIAWAQTDRPQCVANANTWLGRSPRDANAYVARALCYMPNQHRSASWGDLRPAHSAAARDRIGSRAAVRSSTG
jgi:hypothetical protein